MSQGDLLKSFEDISFNKQDAIASVLEEQNIGQYMNLLNLLKRAKLLYSKAHHFQFKDHLLQRDRDFVRDKLLSSYNIPIYIQGKNLDEPFLLFDSDIANTLHQENFNRELLAFLTSEELGFSEQEIKSIIEEQKLEALNRHWSSLNAKKIAKYCFVSTRKIRDDIGINFVVAVYASYPYQDRFTKLAYDMTSSDEDKARSIGDKLLKSLINLGICPTKKK